MQRLQARSSGFSFFKWRHVLNFSIIAKAIVEQLSIIRFPELEIIGNGRAVIRGNLATPSTAAPECQVILMFLNTLLMIYDRFLMLTTL